MMAEGARRTDELFAQAMAAGRLTRDSSLDLPPPPVLPQIAAKPAPPASPVNSYQVQVTGKNVNFYNFAMAHLRTLPGIESASPQQINPGGTSYILVTYRGDISQLAAALSGRGWIVEFAGTVIKLHSDTDKPPAMPPPPVQPPAATPPAPQPSTQPPGQPPKALQ
jgi:hypothetical protein